MYSVLPLQVTTSGHFQALAQQQQQPPISGADGAAAANSSTVTNLVRARTGGWVLQSVGILCGR